MMNSRKDEEVLRLFSLRSFMIFLYIVVVAFIPLALRLRIIRFVSPVETWHRLASLESAAEVFAQFRLESLVIVTVTIIIAALLMYYYEYEKGIFTNSYVDYPTVFFAFLIILSGLLSPYINIAFWGYYDRAEGSFAYLAYLVIFLVAANLIRFEKDRKIILYAALAAGLLQSGIAISQFFGFDVIQTDFFTRLMVPGEILPYVTDIKFKFAHKAYGTTYNPNYLGGYMAMIFPIIFVKYLYSRTTGKAVFWLAATIIGLAGFFAPTSASGFIAAVAAFLFFFILTRKDFKKYYKKLLVMVAVLVLVFSVSENYSNGAILKKAASVYKRNLDILMPVESKEKETVALPASVMEVVAPDSGQKEIEIRRGSWDDIASGRGYIWKKSLEMAKKNILIGDGLDTFVYNFPHWDPERNHRSYRSVTLIDKPHNTYIQIAVGVGGLGLLVYLYILAIHLKNYLVVFRRRGTEKDSDIIALAIFTGWVAYLVQGLGNDSVLSNAPVFWALFGLSAGYVKESLALIIPSKEAKEKRRKRRKK